MQKINCFGDFCPIPLLKAKKIADTLNSNESFVLVTDHSCVLESINDYFTDKSYSLKVLEAINGVWEITITKLI